MLSDLRTTGAWSLDDSYNQQFTSWLDWLIFLSNFLYSSRGSQWKIFWGSNCQRGILQLGQVQKTRSNGRSLIRTKGRMIIIWNLFISRHDFELEMKCHKRIRYDFVEEFKFHVYRIGQSRKLNMSIFGIAEESCYRPSFYPSVHSSKHAHENR